MQPLENIDNQIKDAILVNGGDIDIEDYPYLIKEANEQGISRPELARRIRKIYESIDWRPYNKIDKLLEPIILKGSIAEKEVDSIVKESELDLQRPKVENYILQNIKKRGFLPREKNAFEHDSFRNRWMTDEAWQRYQREKTAVEWLGESAHSLEEMGDISLRKPEDAKYFLRNTNYLVPNITLLTKSASTADAFSKIIEDEPNLDKRYLKVLYRLNRTLPFRLNNQDFATINDLFDKTATDYALYTAAVDQYSKEHIHIWLNETNAADADKLTAGYDYNSFLRFLYKINPHHPFYLDNLRFDTPEQLAQQAQHDVSIWNAIAAATANGQIQVWLMGIGMQDWLAAFNQQLAVIANNNIYNNDEKALATVQSLIHIADKNAPIPTIVSDQQNVTMLSIEGSKTVQHSIHLRLITSGFTKANIFLDKNISGITLNQHYCTLWSQGGATDCTLVITIAALQLIKNKTYSTAIRIDTEYQNIVIPLEIKVVFPKNAFIKEIALYASTSFIFFALIRLLLATQYPDWLSGSFKYFASWDLAVSYSRELAIFGWLMLLLVVSLYVGIYFLIKYLRK